MDDGDVVGLGGAAAVGGDVGAGALVGAGVLGGDVGAGALVGAGVVGLVTVCSGGTDGEAVAGSSGGDASGGVVVGMAVVALGLRRVVRGASVTGTVVSGVVVATVGVGAAATMRAMPAPAGVSSEATGRVSAGLAGGAVVGDADGDRSTTTRPTTSSIPTTGVSDANSRPTRRDRDEAALGRSTYSPAARRAALGGGHVGDGAGATAR